MARPLNPAATLAKWKQRSSNAAQAMKDGVNGVTVAPTQKAAAAVGKYAAGTQRAASDGSFVNGCQAVTLEEWKQTMNGKGAQNYSTGVNNISTRAAKNMADQQAYAANLSAQIQGMPNESDNDAEQRLLAAYRGMKAYRKS